MPLCYICTELDLDHLPSQEPYHRLKCPNRERYYREDDKYTIKLQIYELQSYGRMVKSAYEGCSGCFFFLSMLKENIANQLPLDYGQPLYLESTIAQPLSWNIVCDLPSWAEQSEHDAQYTDEEGHSVLGSPFKFKKIVTVEPKKFAELYNYDGGSRNVDRLGHTLSLLLSPFGKIPNGDRIKAYRNHGTGQIKPLDRRNGSDDRRSICCAQIATDPQSAQSMQIVRMWMNKCLLEHPCWNPQSAILPKRVIDVLESGSNRCRLVEFSQPTLEKYVALSHRWGGKIRNQLVAKKMRSYTNSILLNILPQNFQDATAFTRDIGIRYIWIDALCIIQDDENDWADQAAQMARIYQGALLTLSALTSPHNDAGFLTSRRGNSPAFGKEKDRYLMMNRPDIDIEIGESELNKCGWTAQERLLSPRILHFSALQLFWECRETSYAEIMPYCLRYTFAMVNKNLLLRTANQERSNDFSSVSVPEKFLELTDLWMYCIEEYSGRLLTKAFDKFPAIAGLASAIRYGDLGEYCSGHWERNIHITLTWRPETYVPNKLEQYIAPTWSWASWKGKVWYPGNRLGKGSLKDWLWIEWDEQFQPTLVKKGSILENPDLPYMSVACGTFIAIEGYSTQVYHYGPENVPLPFRAIYGPTFIEYPEPLCFETAWFCIPLPESDNTTIQECFWKKHQGKLHHYIHEVIGFQLYGNLNSEGHSVCLLILAAVDEQRSTYRGIGLVNMSDTSLGKNLTIGDLSEINWSKKTFQVV